MFLVVTVVESTQNIKFYRSWLKSYKLDQKNVSTKANRDGGEHRGNCPLSSFVMSPNTEAQASRLFLSMNVEESSLRVPHEPILISNF